MKRILKKLPLELVSIVIILSVLLGVSASVSGSIEDGFDETTSAMVSEDVAALITTVAFTTVETCTTTQTSTLPETTAAVETTASTTKKAVPATKKKPVTTTKRTTAAADTTVGDDVQADAPSSGELVCLGNFKLTFYCGGPCCNGKWAGMTSTGAPMIEGRTIAVDKSIIPLGTSVYIEGMGWYVAEDVGGGIRGKHIDIYVSDHQRATQMALRYRNVYVRA